MLVVDANVVLAAAQTDAAFEPLAGRRLIAPPLMWSEARSTLHVSVSRGLLARDEARVALGLIEQGPIEKRDDSRLGFEAWRIAGSLGWAKTYDAEYLALASLTSSPLATFDGRLAGAAQRIGVATLDLTAI